MPIELGVWRIDRSLQRLDVSKLAQEDRLEGILRQDITIANPNWLVIGRQVPTSYGTFIDLLAMDRDAHLVVLELKRDRTPREVVAQLLDYGSWVMTLKDEDIASIFEAYNRMYCRSQTAISLDEVFCRRFGLREMPEELNEAHELVVVASALDPSTERIVSYLAGRGVPINAVFFRVYQDEGREYLTRVWFIEPTAVDAVIDKTASDEPWNGEYYVSFGHGHERNWDDAVKYGFVSAGGGTWYTNTLRLLEQDGTVWVNIPGRGYVGVGKVAGPFTKATEYIVKQPDGTEAPLAQIGVSAPEMFTKTDDEHAEFLVPVEWVKTVSLGQAIKEKGLFGNQNTVAKPTTGKWRHTVERLKLRFGLA